MFFYIGNQVHELASVLNIIIKADFVVAACLLVVKNRCHVRFHGEAAVITVFEQIGNDFPNFPVAFAGKGSGEKREILEHLQRFVDTYSGARRRIAKEANGALTYEELLAMSEKKPLPLAKWRIAEAAMRRIEGQDQ